MLPSRILIATDGSDAARAAEAFAAEMATQLHAGRITIVTVLRPFAGLRPIFGKPDEALDTEVGHEVVTEAADRVRKVVGEEQIPVDTKVLVAESEADAIITEAHATGTCSHIVMGDRGLGGFTSLLLGSTSHGVIQGAHCPVTIVRA